MEQVLTFDIYGTLAAWDETLHAAVSAAMPGRASAVSARAARIMDAESRRLQTLGAFRSYVDILRESATFALAEHDVGSDAVDLILSRLADVPSHADAPPVLAELARDFRLVAISNSDDAFLARTLANLGDVWTDAVTAEQARAYKPNPELFLFAQRRHRLRSVRHVHVAQGMFSDLTVCTGLGIPSVWINRTGTTLQHGLAPFATLADLTSLPAALFEQPHGDASNEQEPIR